MWLSRVGSEFTAKLSLLFLNFEIAPRNKFQQSWPEIWTILGLWMKYRTLPSPLCFQPGANLVRVPSELPESSGYVIKTVMSSREPLCTTIYSAIFVFVTKWEDIGLDKRFPLAHKNSRWSGSTRKNIPLKRDEPKERRFARNTPTECRWVISQILERSKACFALISWLKFSPSVRSQNNTVSCTELQYFSLIILFKIPF